MNSITDLNKEYSKALALSQMLHYEWLKLTFTGKIFRNLRTVPRYNLVLTNLMIKLNNDRKALIESLLVKENY